MVNTFSRSRRNLLEASLVGAGLAMLPSGRMLFGNGRHILAATTDLAPALASQWLRRWQQYIVAVSRSRTYDHAMGEDLGWLVRPNVKQYCPGNLPG